jgi:rfaE bifunctional protein nucleotidyltransferase chain/domain
MPFRPVAAGLTQVAGATPLAPAGPPRGVAALPTATLVALRLGLASAAAEQARQRLTPDVLAAGRLLASCLAAGGTALVFGNGGSAADSQHFVSELVGRFRHERRGLPAIALTTDPSTVSGIANDYGYEHVFRRQVEALGRPGDIAIGITTSGRSANVLLGLRQAREQGLATILLAAEHAPRDVADVVIGVPGATTAERQQVHLVVEHILAEFVDDARPPEAFVPKQHRGRPDPFDGRLLRPMQLGPLSAALRDTGHRIAWTNGVFDLLHPGHLSLLEFARAQGDVLVVGLNSDRSTTALKGPQRPLVSELERARLVAALRPVDYVVVFDELDPVASLRRLRPHVHVKDEEYAGRALPEDEVLAEIGIEMAFCPRLVGRSSTDLIARAASGSEHPQS